MNPDDNRPLVDLSRSAHLGGGRSAAVAVDPDGNESLWILVPGADEDTPRDPWPDHERLGPLPARFAQHRCGQPRLDGHPCRTPVAAAGLACVHHRQDDPVELVRRVLGGTIIATEEGEP